VEIVLAARPEERHKVLTLLESFAREHRLPPQVVQAADLSLEEHLTNILDYAYSDDSPHQIRVRLSVSAGWLEIEVQDDGKPFNPLRMPEVDPSVPLDQKPVGGLGIHLIRKFMDEVEYRRDNGANILRLRKRCL
jgi:anti-sigma regulatory factor (Ser/Thr protein kinase)